MDSHKGQARVAHNVAHRFALDRAQRFIRGASTCTTMYHGRFLKSSKALLSIGSVVMNGSLHLFVVYASISSGSSNHVCSGLVSSVDGVYTDQH